MANLKLFFRAKAKQLIVFILIIVIYVVSFLLWRLPIVALFNTSFLATVIFALYFITSYFRWRTNHLHLLDLEERLELANHRISELELEEKELADLLRVWSHQMKVPLSAMDLMVQTDNLDTKAMKNQLFQLDNYLRILLESIRIRNVSSDFRFEKLSVKSVIQSLLKRYSSFFIQKSLSVEITGDWELVTDRRWLEIALEQILSNAVKYTEQGGLKITMTEGSLKIKDSGIGILEEDLPRLFEHGFTGFNGHQAREKSTGLGLYLSKRILDKLGLTIQVSSELGVGTLVEISKDTEKRS